MPAEVHQVPVEKFLDIDRIVRVTNQEYVEGEKVVKYLDKPTPIELQAMVPAKHYKEVPVEMTRTQTIDCRVIDEVIKTEIVHEDVIVPQK